MLLYKVCGCSTHNVLHMARVEAFWRADSERSGREEKQGSVHFRQRDCQTMRLCLFSGLDRIEVGERGSFGDRQPESNRGRESYDGLAVKLSLHESWQAESFVRRYLRGAGHIHRLRALLSSQVSLIQLLGDEEVLRQVANHLQNGNLCAYFYKHEPTKPIRLPGVDSVVRGAEPARAVKPVVTREQLQVIAPAAVEETHAQQDLEAARLEAAAREAIPLLEVCPTP
ncbi:hypothetical protein SAMN03159293_02757 [Pseudomonas sp. NFACC39-1]|nr:hypothetical protein SAMN03159293_02757 [Pseudomonas sp. NFACC39-1]